MVQDSNYLPLTPIRMGARVGTIEVSEVSSNGPPTSPLCRKFIGDPMDRYLASIGLVKKLMPNDKGSSVYRAVCESLAFDQSEYLELKELVESDLLFRYRLQRIRTGLAKVDRIPDTLESISRLLRIDLYVYRNVGEEPQIIRSPKRKEKIDKVLLCESSRGHFDLVYTFEDHKNLAYAQSIIYNLLYVHTFGFSPEVIKEAMDKVRADMDTINTEVATPSSSPYSSFTDEHFSFADSGALVQHLSPVWRPPIPYSAIKALDPSVYRNIAYDLYAKDKREERQDIDADFSDEFRPGTFCFFVEEGIFYEAYIISVMDQGTRLAMVEGNERRVRTCDLLRFGQPWSVDTKMGSTATVVEVDGNEEERNSSTQGITGNVVPTSPTCSFPVVTAPVSFSFEYNHLKSYICQYEQNDPYSLRSYETGTTGNQSYGPSYTLVPTANTISPWCSFRCMSSYYGYQSVSAQQDYSYASTQEAASLASTAQPASNVTRESRTTDDLEETSTHLLQAVMSPSFGLG